jgi:hypothetical protein
MHETQFIYSPPRPGPLLKGLGVVVRVTAISIAAALCFEHYRKVAPTCLLQSMPGDVSALPASNAYAGMPLAAPRFPCHPPSLTGRNA